jgi:hypothetical protein
VPRTITRQPAFKALGKIVAKVASGDERVK